MSRFFYVFLEEAGCLKQPVKWGVAEFDGPREITPADQCALSGTLEKKSLPSRTKAGSWENAPGNGDYFAGCWAGGMGITGDCKPALTQTK